LPETADEDTVTKLLNDFAVYLMENVDLARPQNRVGVLWQTESGIRRKVLYTPNVEKWYKSLYDLKAGSEQLYLLSDEDHIDSKCHPFYLEVQDDYISERLHKDILDANYKEGKMIYAHLGT
jgi:hypothetical protein